VTEISELLWKILNVNIVNQIIESIGMPQLMLWLVTLVIFIGYAVVFVLKKTDYGLKGEKELDLRLDDTYDKIVGGTLISLPLILATAYMGFVLAFMLSLFSNSINPMYFWVAFFLNLSLAIGFLIQWTTENNRVLKNSLRLSIAIVATMSILFISITTIYLFILILKNLTNPSGIEMDQLFGAALISIVFASGIYLGVLLLMIAAGKINLMKKRKKESDYHKKALEFDRWVKTSLDLFHKKLSYHLYHTLYRFNSLTNQDTNFLKLLLDDLEIIKNKNIKKITTSTISGFDGIVEETKNNIIFRNYWATFYGIIILYERTADAIIKRENQLLTTKFAEIKRKLNNDGLGLSDKIKYLKEINKTHQTQDLKLLIGIGDMLARMRNKFMFHVKTYDDYYFVFRPNDIGKKETLLKKNLKSIKKEVDNVLKLLQKVGADRNILQYYSASLKGMIDYYDSNQSTKDSIINSSLIYGHFPKIFAELSQVFILFFSKEDLKLFKEGKDKKLEKSIMKYIKTKKRASKK